MTFHNPYQDAIDALCPPGYRFGTGWMDEFERQQAYYRANNIPAEKHVEAYMELFAKVRMMRDELVQKYSWAIPTQEAIERIAELSPIVDWCAGNGYWGHLLQEAGAEVQCYTIEPGDNAATRRVPAEKVNDAWKSVAMPPTKCWTEVTKCKSASKLRWLHARTLLLVWPPYDDSVASDCLEAFKGEYVVQVGEHGGCTADERFFELIEQGWDEVDCITIPSWDGLHDDVWIWRRK